MSILERPIGRGRLLKPTCLGSQSEFSGCVETDVGKELSWIVIRGLQRKVKRHVGLVSYKEMLERKIAISKV